MSQKKLQIWLPLLLAAAVFTGMLFGYKLRSNMGSFAPSFFKSKQKTSLEEILELVRTRYVDTLNTDSLGMMAVQNVINQLDPHSVYIPASNVQAVNDDMKGSFEGVGIEFGFLNDTVTVLRTFPGGPAETAGIQIADQLMSANDSLISGVKSGNERIRTLFRGPRGTDVTVKLLRNGVSKTITIQRGVIPVKSVDVAYMLEPGIGFIRLNKFSANTYEDFMQNLERLQKEGMKQLILDLRDNGGGMLDDAIQIADEFLSDNKDIVYTEGKASPRQVYTARRPGLFEEGNLVVLIDEGSASASEVLTGALQDWDRAIIVGRRSYGKGLVQEQFQLSDGSALRLTISRYYTPIGRSIQKPYNRGEGETYKDEIMRRYNEGALFVNDTSKHIGKVFKTKGGRKVYGAGGISPDIFVPADSAAFLLFKKYTTLYDVIEEAAIKYYLINSAKVKAAQSPVQLRQLLMADPGIWSLFSQQALRHNLPSETFSASQQQVMKESFFASVAHILWGKEGYYKMSNLNDSMVQKALEQVKK